ncbi:MAG: cyclic nucleotide-binding domain-containing protein, partial [Myxococcota bacterium]
QVLGSRALIAHVGDSRAYLVRQENLHLMTADHTGAAELMRGMKWSETQAMKSPFSSVLTRAVGTESSVEVDTLIFDIFSEDRLLLCSDGLTHHVHDRDELRGLLDQPFDSTATLLIDRANEAGGRDNISAIVVRIEGEDDEPGPHRVNQHESELSALAQAFGFEAIRLRPLQRLLNLARRRALDPGEVVAERGEAFDRLILVVSGELELVREESRLSSVGPGQSVGRRLLFEPGAIQASLRAVEPSTVLEIESEGFWGVMRWHPVLSLKVLSRAAWLGHQRVQRLVHEGLPPEPEDLF